MSYKLKIWVGRDQTNELRAHVNQPYWIHGEYRDGYFHSDGRTWQLDVDELPEITKGEYKCVYIEYNFLPPENL